MQFAAIAQSDKGNVKKTNQDSVLVKHVRWKEIEIVLAIICDGMGGLSKGELASATVIREFDRWFDEECVNELPDVRMNVIGEKWRLMLAELNVKISEYGQKENESLGTTFTGLLLIDDEYLIVHVGDTRAYYIDRKVNQLTKDHTFIARELERGTITLSQAKNDKRRNMLLQCVGASEKVKPDVITGRCQPGVYMLCSDGFRHQINDREIYNAFNPDKLKNKNVMNTNAGYLIDLNKNKNEKDNISVVVIKAY